MSAAASTDTAPLHRALSYDLDAEGILVATLDVPGEKVNALSRSLANEFTTLIEGLESRTDVSGVILRSGKPDNFIAGADIRDFGTIRSQLEGETLSREGQVLLDRLEALRVPVVAAIHGACLGGGLETALACHYRVASDDPKTVLGLPEVMLGLIPGGGGTQRLPRLIGIVAALDLILTGKTLKARRALTAGVVDEVVPPAVLMEAARAAVRGLAAGTLKPRRGGIPLREKLMRPLIFYKARATVMEKGGRHYPAPLKALEVVRTGTATSMAEGLKQEAKAFGELAVTDVSRALVSVFFATQEIKKDAGYPEGTTARDVEKLGVLGAGLMGAGIAGAAADTGARVRLRDTSEGALGRALRHARDLLEERRKRGSLPRLDLQKKMDLLSVSTDYSGFRRADLVIEAVFEDIDLKRQVLAEVEGATLDECVFASN
ncbi:MAG TPA: enoyl-CoA hydratase-related protein, partial [Vicinamibacteria bacterium]|nr:enoyl-CoA hydratase-related protein [Vicinamibacteria bacterium]